VVFGILHCIGLSLALAIPLAKVKPRNLALLGFGVIVSGVFLAGLRFDFPWLLWLGAAPAGFASIDYFPLLPWLGFLLLGVAFAKKFYSKTETSPRKIRETKKVSSGIITSGLAFLGRHSLAVYLVHQPLLLAALLAIGVKPPGLNLFGLA